MSIYAQISQCVMMFVFVFALQVSAATLTKANRLHFPDCIGISNGIKIKIENEIAIAIEMEIEKGNRVVDFRRQGRICLFLSVFCAAKMLDQIGV